MARVRRSTILVAFACVGCPSSPPPVKQPTTTEALANVGRSALEVYAEGALDGAGGIVAVAFLSEGGLSLVVREKGGLRVHPIAYFDDTKFEVGFADLDGDDRADAVLFTPACAHAFLTPKADALEPTSVAPDDAAGLAMIGATSVNDAVGRARAVPRRGLTAVEACALLGKVTNAAELRKVTTPEFRWLSYSGSGAGSFAHAPQQKAAASVTDDEAKAIGFRCAPDQLAAMSCSSTRPTCLAGSYADGTYFWFEWPNGKLRLAAAAASTAK